MLFSNSLISIEIHDSEIPWLKVFTKRPIKEFSECNRDEKEAIWEVLDIIEKEMITYFKPEKINIASFGNMLPHVHWHIMARFKEDSYFPEPMWGSKQRDGFICPAPMEPFFEGIKEKLSLAFRA